MTSNSRPTDHSPAPRTARPNITIRAKDIMTREHLVTVGPETHVHRIAEQSNRQPGISGALRTNSGYRRAGGPG